MRGVKLPVCPSNEGRKEFLKLFSIAEISAETTCFTFKHVCHVYDHYFEKGGIN